MGPLLAALVEHVPPPAGLEELARPFAFSVAFLERDPYIGRIATGVMGLGWDGIRSEGLRAGLRAGVPQDCRPSVPLSYKQGRERRLWAQ
jgi:hypothetical protein